MIGMPRGKDAIQVEDSGTQLTITAMLADGARLGRRDDVVFKRTIILQGEVTCYRIAVKVVDACNGKKFPEVVRSAKLDREFDGMSISVKEGILRAVVSVTPAAMKRWKKSRVGDTRYALAQFLFGMDRMCAATICVSYWTPVGTTQVPAWVLKER